MYLITKSTTEGPVHRRARAYRAEAGLDRDIIANKVKGQGDLPAYGYAATDGAKLSEPNGLRSQEKRNEEAKKLLAKPAIAPINR